MLDAYTESPTASSMSDSDKFKEGYVKKKDKGKQKNRTAKKSETEEEHEEEVADCWDAEGDGGEVIESWDQMEVEDQPVPLKVKQTLRKEEKKRKKEEQKKANQPNEKENESAESESSKLEEKESSKEPIEEVTQAVEKMTVNDGGGKKPAREYTEEEKAAIKADREAKKAAKANKKAGVKDDKASEPSQTAASTEQSSGAEGKTKEQLKAERKAAFELQQKMKAEAAGGAESSGQAEKSKAELKAERRAKQEAQRAAKEAGQKKVPEQNQANNNKESTKESKVKVPDEIKADDKKTEKKMNKTLKEHSLAPRPKAQRQIGLFSHLYQYDKEVSVTKQLPVVGSPVHPAIVQLGLQHAEAEVVGSSGRCTSLLLALKTLLLDSLQQLASSSDINKDVDNLLKPNLTFLRQVSTNH